MNNLIHLFVFSLFFDEQINIFLLSIYLESPSHSSGLISSFTTKQFSKVFSSVFSPTLSTFCVFHLSHSDGSKMYRIIVLFCILLLTSEVDYLL